MAYTEKSSIERGLNAKGLLAMRKSITTRLCLIFAMAISAPCAGVEDHASIGKKDDPMLLYDRWTDDWREHWTLNGQKATLTHSDKGMDFRAGPTFREDANRAALWTKLLRKNNFPFRGNLDIIFGRFSIANSRSLGFARARLQNSYACGFDQSARPLNARAGNSGPQERTRQ